MNASRPEASDEYSTTARRPSPPGDRPTRLPWAPLCLGIGGALALLVAQFTPLLRIMTVARHPVLVRTVQTGPHHGWALVPVAVLALWVSALTRRIENRAALGAIALLGLATLAVALLVDLPGVHTSGIVGTGPRGHRAVPGDARRRADAACGGRRDPVVRRRRPRRAGPRKAASCHLLLNAPTTAQHIANRPGLD
jgi:hypothetical protein